MYLSFPAWMCLIICILGLTLLLFCMVGAEPTWEREQQDEVQEKYLSQWEEKSQNNDFHHK